MKTQLLFHHQNLEALRVRDPSGSVSLHGYLCGLLGNRGRGAGRIRVEDDPNILEHGEFLLMPGGCRATFSGDDSSLHDLILLRENPKPYGQETWRGYESSLVAFLKKALTATIHTKAPLGTFVAFERLLMEAPSLKPAYIASQAILMILNLLQSERRKEAQFVGSTRPLYREKYLISLAKDYLRKHHGRKVTLDEVAWYVRVSGEHLSRIFRTHEDVTVFHVLREIRITEARRLLAYTDESLNAIAEKTGFSSIALFCRTFKNAVQCTPTGYRNRKHITASQ